jgi:formylglycine-generating enzyme required for sulfatase activity
LAAYHHVYASYPPAAYWNTDKFHSLALHHNRRFDRFVQANWAVLLLPHLADFSLSHEFDTTLPLSAEPNRAVAARDLPGFRCPSDVYNSPDNTFIHHVGQQNRYEYARGNYGYNGGSHNFKDGTGTTSFPHGDHAHLIMDHARRQFAYWGNGMGGFNVCFTENDFLNGKSSFVALDEMRAGIHPLDPRGVWAVGQVGGSVTWAHGVNGDAYGPNQVHARSDDILNCKALHEIVGSARLNELGMPCVSYIDQNFQATARSAHPGGVHVLLLDGAVRFVTNEIDPGLWHIMHSRETPESVLAAGIDAAEQQCALVNQEASASSAPEFATRMESFSNSVQMNFVLIPSGAFTMGQPDQHNSYDLPQEVPAHTVVIPRSFLLSATEVTQQEFASVMFPDRILSGEPRLPVTNVTWDDAQEFCQSLSSRPAEQRAGRHYRLPTEAEWEYACRAGESLPGQWVKHRLAGDQSGDNGGIEPPLPLLPVGSYPPNQWGLYDMRGNAWEWCADWFDRDYYLRSPQVNPQGPAHGYIKVVRGSDWIFVGEGCKINYPLMPPWKTNPVVGFRVVCEQSGNPLP